MGIFSQLPGVTDAAGSGARFGNRGPEDRVRRRVGSLRGPAVPEAHRQGLPSAPPGASVYRSDDGMTLGKGIWFSQSDVFTCSAPQVLLYIAQMMA